MGQVAVEVALPGQMEPDVLAVTVSDDGPSVLSAAAQAVDDQLGGRLRALVAAGEARSEVGDTLLLHTNGDLGARRVVTTGLGPVDEVDPDTVRTAAAAVARASRNVGGTLAWLVDDRLPLAPEEQARAVVEGVVLASYEPDRWKTEPRERRAFERIVLWAEDEPALRAAAERTAQVSHWVDVARDLANSPPNELTPAALGDRAAGLGVGGLTTEVLDPAQIEQLGMGALAAVGRGSRNGPRLIVLRYEPQQATEPDVTLGLVGKAITFDAGGISLKPALNMQDMKGDMSGGAAVVAGTAAVADLGLPVRILTVVAAAENLVGGDSFRPGDILRAASGKTIEITNTDAEGRLVLADALWYARREGATHVLDLATLTGAMELALGDLYAGVFANDDGWRDRIVAAGERSGDHVWPFPLHRRYRRYVDSAFADLMNSSDLRQAVPALAAEFLHEFAGDGPWAHIDMAGPAFLERSRGDYLWQRGGTGYGVRLIVELARSLAGEAAG
jgi:leucyl aminopeptidase